MNVPMANQNNRKISILGLGQMGRKLAQLYADAGYEVTVWNRTPGKTNKLSKVQVADTAEHALLASPLSVVIIANNAGVNELIGGLSDRQILKDKTLINFTTGSPAEADALEKSVTEAGGAYIHGSIQASPDQLGAESVAIVSSGNTTAFDQYREALTVIGTKLRHLGDKASVCLAMDIATTTWMYGAFVGLIYGATFARQHGLDLKDYAAIIGDIAPDYTDFFKLEVGIMDRGNFQDAQNPVSLHIPIAKRMVEAFKEANIQQDFSNIVLDIFSKTEQKGHGAESLAAISKIIAPQS